MAPGKGKKLVSKQSIPIDFSKFRDNRAVKREEEIQPKKRKLATPSIPGHIVPYHHPEEPISMVTPDPEGSTDMVNINSMVVSKPEGTDVVNFKDVPKTKTYRCGYNALINLSKRLEPDPAKRKKRNEEIRLGSTEKKLLWFEDEQLEVLETSPFWNMSKPFIYKELSTAFYDWKKSVQFIESIIGAYKNPVKGNSDEEVGETDHYFVFEDSDNKFTLRSTANHLAIYFEIRRPRSGAAIKQGTIKMAGEIDVLAYFKESEQFKKTDIETIFVNILESETEDVYEIKRNGVLLAKLLTLYLCVTVFFTTEAGNSLPKNVYGKHFVTLFKMNNTDWPHLIHENLMSSIRNQKAGPLSVNGCVIHILYLFASHSNYFNQGNKKFPRMTRWILKELTLNVDMKKAVSMLSKSLMGEGWSEEEKRLTLESVILYTDGMRPDIRIKMLENQLLISKQLLAKADQANAELQSTFSVYYDFVQFVHLIKYGLESLKSRGFHIPEDKYRADIYEIFNRMKETITNSWEEEDSDTENQDSEEDATKKKSRGHKIPSLDGNILL